MLLQRALCLAPILASTYAYTSLSDDSLRGIPSAGDDFNINTGSLLAPILQPRVPGTPGSTAVLTHFVNFFQQSLPLWDLTFQNSTSTTPNSPDAEVPFVNLIATRDPPWTTQGQVGRLALVAHYDSKLTPIGFIGATDSAAPCAMLMHVARSIDKALTQKWKAMEAEGLGEGGFDGVEDHIGIQIILLDGEEAFQSWTATDSLYGARSLAEEWETSFNQAAATYQTPLHAIDLFVLLDLLGAPQPNIPSYFKTTHWAYQRMASVEARLRSLGQLKTSSQDQFLKESGKTDNERWLGGYVEDDHVPFQERGVDILHMIPYPFPKVWHKPTDDGEHLDIDTVEDWSKVVTAFTAEWLDLEGFMETAPAPAKPVQARHTVTVVRDTKDELTG